MWSIAKGVLWLLDGIFNVINSIWQYKFFENEYVNTIFNGAIIVACSWLALKVVIELIMNYIIKSEDRNSPLSVFKGIVLAIVMMFLIPSLFNFGHSFSTELTKSVISVSGIEQSSSAEGQISRSLIQAMVYDNETKPEDKMNLVLNWKSININATEGGVLGFGDVYKYSLNFFMLIILAIITIFLLFFVAIQMAKRVLEVSLFKIIGPFCCTSLTNSQSKTFETWAKSTMGLFLITVVQFVSIGLLLSMFSSAFKDNGTLTGIFLIIGALLFIISTPTLINTLLNQQSGVMTAFGMMQSMIVMKQGFSMGASLIKAGTSGALSVGSNIVKGGNRLLTGGMDKISNMFNNQKAHNELINQVKESIGQNNSWRANEHIKKYMDEKNISKSNNGFQKQTNPMSFPSMQYNPIRNQYMSNSGLEANNRFDRRV